MTSQTIHKDKWRTLTEETGQEGGAEGKGSLVKGGIMSIRDFQGDVLVADGLCFEPANLGIEAEYLPRRQVCLHGGASGLLA